MKKIILTKDAPAPIGPYSQAVRVGNLLFCSGMIPLVPSSGEIAQGDVKAQTKQVMDNIAALLKSAELDLSRVVKTTIFLKSMADFPVVNEVYGSYFKGEFPARSTVEVSRLPKDVSVEIEVIAIYS
ncbi:MAG: RidA family protein [Cryobacterium sp.]|nr:RidA family protein [Oligoflexia bacterium]